MTAPTPLRTVEVHVFHVPTGAPTPAEGRVLLIRMPGVMMDTARPRLMTETQCDCGIEPAPHLARMVRVESEKVFASIDCFSLQCVHVHTTERDHLTAWARGDEWS